LSIILSYCSAAFIDQQAGSKEGHKWCFD
jgi:hypothetical protein